MYCKTLFFFIIDVTLTSDILLYIIPGHALRIIHLCRMNLHNEST